MAIMQKLAPYVAVLGIGATGASSVACGGAAARGYATVDEASKVLGMSYGWIAHLPNGYKTDKGTQTHLRTIAGIRAGTVKVAKTENGYAMRGSFSQVMHPELFAQVVSEADTDGNMVVDRDETRALMQKTLETVKGMKADL